MGSTAAPFQKGSSLQAVPGWDMLGEQPCSLPCETKGSHLTLREKLGQITALKPGQKKQCWWGTIAVQPITVNVVMCAGAVLDFQLNPWEKCIIYWHCFANYFNAIFITALNNKPWIFVMEEEDACLVSKQNTKATAWSRLSSLRSLLKNELLLTAPSLLLPCPPPFLSWTSSRESSLCYHSGCWWTLTPCSSLTLSHRPCSSPGMGENMPVHLASRISTQGCPVPVSGYVSGFFSTEMGWVFAAIEIVSEDLKHNTGENGFNGCSFISRLSLHHIQPALSNTLATVMWDGA